MQFVFILGGSYPNTLATKENNVLKKKVSNEFAWELL